MYQPDIIASYVTDTWHEVALSWQCHYTYIRHTYPVLVAYNKKCEFCKVLYKKVNFAKLHTKIKVMQSYE